MLHDEQCAFRSRMEITGVAVAAEDARAGGEEEGVARGGSADFAGSVMSGAGLAEAHRI
jgi:hypothetical protein